MSGGDSPLAKVRTRAAIIAGAAALAAAGLYAWRAKRAVPDPEPVPPAYAGLRRPAAVGETQAGHRLFVDNCAPCHDEGGTGHGPGSEGLTVPPAALSSPGFLEARSDAYLFWRISEGKPGTAMPSFKHTLSADERWAVIAWLRASWQR